MKHKTKRRVRPPAVSPAVVQQEVSAPAPAFVYTAARFFVLLALIILILIARKPDSFLNPQFWAEDGTIFYREQLVHGAKAVLLPYNGYLHLVPRLIALLEAPLPAVIAPLLCAWLGVAIQALCYSFPFWPGCRYLIRSDLVRVAAVVVLASGFQANDLLANSANAQWHLLLPGLLLMFLPNGAEGHKYRLPGSMAAVLIAVIALTAPVLILMLPFTSWRAFRRKGRERLISAVASTALLIQLAVVSVAPRTDQPAWMTDGFGLAVAQVFTGALVSWTYRVLLTDIAGRDAARAVSAFPNPAPFLAILIIVVVGLGWWTLRSTPEQRKLLYVGLYITAGSISTALFMRNLIGYFQSTNGIIQFEAPRYFVAAGYVLVGLAAQLVDRAGSRRSELARAGLLMLLFVGGIRGNFRIPTDPDYAWKRYAPAVQLWKDHWSKGLPVKHTEAPVVPAPHVLSLPDEHEDQSFWPRRRTP